MRDPLTPHDRRRVAVEAERDDRAVRRYLAGGRVYPDTAERVSAALTRLGFSDLVRA